MPGFVRAFVRLSVVGFLLAACRPAPAPSGAESPPPPSLPMPQGIAVGDVTQHRAVIWSRTERDSVMHVEIASGKARRHRATRVHAGSDFTGKIVVDRLEPGQRYTYAVWFSDDPSARRPSRGALEGRFTTPPAVTVPAPVRFAFSGDLGGQNVCRDAAQGYPIFEPLGRDHLDFFIGLGDMIYGDDVCEAIGRQNNPQIAGRFGPAATIREYWAHWKYNRADPGFQTLLRNTSYIGVWDDHEVVNDFDPKNDTRSEPPYVPGASLLPLGRRALLDENPIFEDPAAPHRLYRAFRWGQHVDLIVLDTRQYRDPDPEPDHQASPKTLLGKAQRAWLEQRLRTSTATWRIVVSSVSLGIPTGAGGEAGRDGWAGFSGPTGYERELDAILRRASDISSGGLVWLATDVHFATGIRYRPFDDRPDFSVHEIVAGPLSAGLFPRKELDRTFHPQRLFYYAPEDTDSIETFREIVPWFNFGVVDVDESGRLRASIINGRGEEVAALELEPRG